MISKSKLNLRLSAGALLFAMSASHAAAANAEDSDDRSKAGQAASQDNAGQDIIVTANKREESINKVGLTIKALGGAQLEQQHVMTLQDLAAAVPGLNYAQTENNTPVYTLRGIGYYDTTLAAPPAVSVYMDQAPLPYPVMTTLALFDIERVEVLKGPQGTLFGQNATGGAINYIAAKPTKDPSAGLDLTYGRFNTFTGDGYVSGPITDNLLGRIAVSATSGDGWQRSASRPGDKNGAPDTFAARFLLDWRPTDRLRIQTNLNGWRDRSQPEAAQFVEYIPNFNIPLPVDYTTNATKNARIADWSTDSKPSSDNRLLQATMRVDYDVTDAIKFTSLTGYEDYKQDMVPEGDGVFLQRNDIHFFKGYIHSFSQEVRLSDNDDPVFRWTIGANYSRDKSFDLIDVWYKDATARYAVGGASNESSVAQLDKNYAGFASGEYTLGKFVLKGGVRYTESDRSAVNCLFALNEDGQDHNPLPDLFGATAGQCFTLGPDFLPQAIHGTLNQHNVSWRAGVDWKPVDGVLAYVNVAKGYKAGSFGNFGGATYKSYLPVTQESVLTYEGGVKAQLFDRKLSFNGAVFYSDYRDKQIKSKIDTGPPFGKLIALLNVPKSYILGAEFEGTVRPVAGLTIGGAVTYLDAKITDATDRSDSDGGNLFTLAGLRAPSGHLPMPYASKWTLEGNVNYSFQIGSTKAFIAAQIMHRTKTNASIGGEDGDIVVPYPTGPWPYTGIAYDYDFSIPGYTTVNAQAGVDLAGGKYHIMVWGKNIFNKFYITNRNDSFDGIAQFAGQPVTYGVTVGFRI
jgi:outer membrane receptor protein involved in Fe transport